MPDTKPKSNFPFVLILVVVASIGLAWWLRSAGPGSPGTLPGLEPGKPLPSIQATGWLNGGPVIDDDLKGKVVVIDAWASWCGPCRASTPHLIDVHRQFEDRNDVVFIGLSSEADDAIPAMEEFIADTEMPWPTGYGAIETLTALEAEVIPFYWVVGRDGVVAWNSNSTEPMEDAIETALAVDR